ncbi:RNA 2'-phosphotransferase [Catenibacterium sp. AM22-15]|uniref:RNA 2'-phosphotransferase n=1 Tax=unclassified Catenibacterium TaxID=2643636 RepID=UPI000E3F7D7D|nr:MULTISPECIES: RNA 2'-phosphotransferase [unclassified Catenibacterium]RGE98636.1 RNA 2'-phosphotransferase [Catenibacterium sp. AM22-6LB]RGF07614.1 RNA 2'-phosphotransferase [Catenibacterium sp. AM22-15]
MERKSRRLSYILRHCPESIGLELDDHGYGDVQKILDALNITLKQLDTIVREDEKQRYSYNVDHTRIRANQGHSIPVNADLKEVQPPDILYHGTATRFVSSILEEGILSQTRLYVHLSQDKETATKVGSRHGEPYVFIIDTKQMYKDGYKFFLSENNIYLTKIIPTKYLLAST